MRRAWATGRREFLRSLVWDLIFVAVAVAVVVVVVVHVCVCVRVHAC